VEEEEEAQVDEGQRSQSRAPKLTFFFVFIFLSIFFVAVIFAILKEEASQWSQINIIISCQFSGGGVEKSALLSAPFLGRPFAYFSTHGHHNHSDGECSE
jgi:hypothetical protein